MFGIAQLIIHLGYNKDLEVPLICVIVNLHNPKCQCFSFSFAHSLRNVHSQQTTTGKWASDRRDALDRHKSAGPLLPIQSSTAGAASNRDPVMQALRPEASYWKTGMVRRCERKCSRFHRCSARGRDGGA